MVDKGQTGRGHLQRTAERTPAGIELRSRESERCFGLSAGEGGGIRHQPQQREMATQSGRLRNWRAFRVPLPKSLWESIEAAKFDGKIQRVKALIGAMVEDTEGNRYPVKKV